MRHLFHDRSPPPTRHQLLSPQSTSSSSRACIFEIHPTTGTRQQLCPEDTSTPASPPGYLDSLPNVPLNHGGDVLAVMSAALSGRHPPSLAEQGPCLSAGVVAMDNSSVTTKVKIHSGPVAVQLDCVALLETGSPQTFINSYTLESMKSAGAVSAIRKRRTPPRSWGGSASPRLSRPSLQYA